MKRLTILAVALMCCVQLSAQEKFLVAGSGNKSVSIVSKEGEVEWSYDIPERSECNSVVYTKDDNVLFSYKYGAKLVSLDGEVIFDYKTEKGVELQSVSAIKGGFLFGICGNPMRIVEVNKKGEVKSEVTFDTGIDNPHAQFRQIRKSRKGTYLIPLLATNKIVELDSNGEKIREITLEHGAFSLVENKRGDIFAACGHSGYVYKVDGKSGELSTISDKKEMREDVVIQFGAEMALLKSGNLLMANWLGHKGDLSQPILIEFNEQGEVVWTMNRLEGIKFISAVAPIY